MSMEPKPVITYFGDGEVISAVLQKKLQARLKQLQLATLPKEEPLYSAFSSLCDGVEFVHFSVAQERSKNSNLAYFQHPTLHTFWTGCSENDRYHKYEHSLINQWLRDCETYEAGPRGGTRPECVIVYCITPEVRARRHRTLSVIGGINIEEKIKNDFKTKADEIIQFRLASSEEARLVESYHSVTAKLNSKCLVKFRKDIEQQEAFMAKLQKSRYKPEMFYNHVFIPKINIGVGYEMTLRNEKALALYKEAQTDLESALSMFVDHDKPPSWLESMRNASCTTWDYPKLVWSQVSWQYLREVQSLNSPLLHTRTFLLARISHLLFLQGRAWTVSELCISTLHTMAREINMLKLQFPAGAFDCWAYMTCNEAIQAIMVRLDADSLVSATPSLLLVRAELWRYALEKLHAIGVLCGLMPSINKLNHDQVLVKQISSGVTLVSPQVPGVEDQGKRLINILKERSSFHQEYLSLGEMVIGAFKHAGRRRMAFRVGAMIAQFHKDLGLITEAEELLSDICKFYSEDQWIQLSTKAYSLLADCQMKLRLEDKHVNTMLLLASLPPYPGASHDPNQWLDSLMKVAHKSPYQKILSWEPLMELVSIDFTDAGREKRNSLMLEDTLAMKIVINYNGPKEMKSIIATVQMRPLSTNTIGPSPVPSVPSSPPPGSHTPQKDPDPSSPSISLSSLTNLDELDLSSKKLPPSRPIGALGKYRSNTNPVTHISSSDVAEAGWGDETKGQGKSRDLMLINMRVSLKPGHNKFTVEGKVSLPGEYMAYKVSLKYGSLEFVTTLKPELSQEMSINVQPNQVNADIVLTPKLGAFIASYPQGCVMSFITGSDTTIPADAAVSIVTHDDIQCTLEGQEVELTSHEDTNEVAFKLPEIPPDSSHDIHVTLTVPSMQVVGVVNHTHQPTPKAWKHEIEVYCDWLTPQHVAKLPIVVYEPLTFVVMEQAAGDHAYLHMTLTNTSTLPVALRSPSIVSDIISLTQLHGELPRMLCPQEDYSCLWMATPTSGYEQNCLTYQLDIQPLADEEVEISGCGFNTLEHTFNISNMKLLYEVRATVQPHKDAALTVRSKASLKYTIANVSGGVGPHDLRYKVNFDPKHWSLQDAAEGNRTGPAPGKAIELTLLVIPNEFGVLPVPTLTLSQQLSQTKGEKVGRASGSDELEDDYVILSDAQVANHSLGQVVSCSGSL